MIFVDCGQKEGSGAETVFFFGKERTEHLKVCHNGDIGVASVRELDWVVLHVGPLHVDGEDILLHQLGCLH